MNIGRGVRFLLMIVLIAATTIYLFYSRDMKNTRESLAAGSRIALTDHGSIEYASWGSGPPILVLHGTGGGYDQGILIAKAFGGQGFRWIAPSRFCYLRTPLPADASTAAQSDALADLLDMLGIDRVGILAISGGVPPALQFTLRHPTRTAALVLLSSAPFTPLTAAEQELPVPLWVYQTLFNSDFPYWALKKIARPGLQAIFDVKPELRVTLSHEEQVFVANMIDAFSPVTLRMDGLSNEGAAIDPSSQFPLKYILAPTLVIHSRNDGINPYSFREYTARQIQGARLVPMTTGGHLLLGHHTEIRARVSAFLRESALSENEFQNSLDE